ncbi:F-box-like [Rhizoctonia solani]|uniref:F-box-like n=2 Tax=Rhizoctonia solani TaxID=456999 RepID=A0A8H7H5Q9_9AGAM|nr:F-box-like [Rhizoctonia solani]
MTQSELIKDLNEASNLLKMATNKYTEACAAILNSYDPSGNSQDLLNSAIEELPRAFSYESNIEKAISLMWRVRNQSLNLVRINVLPPEIISRIFWFAQRCCLPKSQFTRRNEKSGDNMVYPETALEVCHRWREIALASHDLWSHIDIDLTSGSEGPLFSRALAFAARSNQVPLYLHIRVDFYCREDERLSEFCHSIVSRTRSIELQCDCRTPLHRNVLPFLANLLSWDTSGTIRGFYIDAQPMQEARFLTASHIPVFDEHSRISLTQIIPLKESIFEKTMSLVTSIRLVGIYPCWSSRAYAGLVELDLDSTESAGTIISELALAGILRASPGLRAFRFGLNMTLESGYGLFALRSVKLEHLETIKLTGRYTTAQEAVLRMIYPGQLPLQMIVEVIQHYKSGSPSSYWIQFMSFVSRSRIAQLHIKGVAESQAKIFLGGSELFSLLPQLQVLTLCEVIVGQPCEEVLEDYDAVSFLRLLHGYCDSHFGLNLQLVRLTKCKIYWNDFRYMSEIHPTHALILERCHLVTIPSNGNRFFFSHRQDVRSTLMNRVKRVFPAVEFEATYVELEKLSDFRLASPMPYQKARYQNNATLAAEESGTESGAGSAFAVNSNPNAPPGLFGAPASSALFGST